MARTNQLITFSLAIGVLLSALTASAVQASGWGGYGANETGPTLGMNWNGSGSYTETYSWPPTAECNCELICPNPDANTVGCSGCDPNLCVPEPWQTLGQSPVIWHSYYPVSPSSGTFPPPGHELSVTGMQFAGVRTQSTVTANDLDGYLIEANGSVVSRAAATTYMFPTPVSSFTLSGHEPTNFDIRFGLIFTAPTGPNAQVTVTPLSTQPVYPLVEAIADFSNVTVASPDLDADGYTVAQGDCNDNNFHINPGVSDLTIDTIDQNCDGIDGVAAWVGPKSNQAPSGPKSGTIITPIRPQVFQRIAPQPSFKVIPK